MGPNWYGMVWSWAWIGILCVSVLLQVQYDEYWLYGYWLSGAERLDVASAPMCTRSLHSLHADEIMRLGVLGKWVNNGINGATGFSVSVSGCIGGTWLCYGCSSSMQMQMQMQM